MSQNDLFKDFTDDCDVLHGLPSFAYNSDDVFTTESEQVFSKSWVLAGLAHELSNRGDVRPVTIAQKPVLLVRSEAGRIRAFHNVCRHRCLKLVDQPRNAGRVLSCPYHSWSYNLEGKLLATPFFGGRDHQPPPGFNKEENGLVEIQCEVWHDWVFVNLDDKAGPFDEFIEPIATRLSHLDLNLLKPVAVLDFGVLNINWKFLMENFIEPYHVQFVHSKTTDQPLANHHTLIDKHCLGCTVEVNQPVKRSGTLAVDSNFLTLFPSFVLGTYEPDQLGVHLNTPVSAGETHQRRAIYILRDSEIPEDEIEALKTLWWNVHKEDHEMCERLQQGRASHVADTGGLLSPKWETGVRRFQEFVLNAIQ